MCVSTCFNRNRVEFHPFWNTLKLTVLPGGYVHPALEPSLVSHGGISMMGVISSSSESLPEGTVVIELPRLALLDVDLLGSMPEDCYGHGLRCH